MVAILSSPYLRENILLISPYYKEKSVFGCSRSKALRAAEAGRTNDRASAALHPKRAETLRTSRTIGDDVHPSGCG